MTRRWIWIAVVLIVLESGLFYAQYNDIVSLSRSADTLVSDPSFVETARAVLARDRVSRRVLERIAEVASRQKDHALQLAALDRIAQRLPDDREVQLRRADTLRTMGRLDEAGLVYAGIAGTTRGDRP
jgi:ABC-type protease/lipase transport system fused ATPase/permease subunit